MSGIKLPEVKQTLIDRVIGWASPERGMKRMQARVTMAMVGGYTGARRDRRQTKGWTPKDGDADSAILWDLDTLRTRSRDLERNAPLATGAINTKVTSVVGTGIKPRPALDSDVLKLTEEQVDAWEAAALREFRLATSGKDFSLDHSLTFYQSQDLVFRSVLSAGDVFVNLLREKRPGLNPYTLRTQLIEADRVCNKDGKADTSTLVAGVEKNANGKPVKYHVAKHHPGNMRSLKKREWEEITAFHSSGRPNILHLYRKLRPGQTRGVPDLAPVIEMLKQVAAYTESELHAAVVSSLFTVFVKSSTGNPQINMPQPGGKQQTQTNINTEGLELGSGAVLGLAENEDIEIADPKRPNVAAEAFLRAMAEQVGVSLELPYELLVKHFTSSYSAARAALLEAWRFFLRMRSWMAEEFCRPVWGLVITEAIARGRLAAPGFFTDPLVRQAYLGCEWVGDTMGQLNPLVEVKAARERVDGGFSTEARETIMLTGGDWDRDERQREKEKRSKNSSDDGNTATRLGESNINKQD